MAKLRFASNLFTITGNKTTLTIKKQRTGISHLPAKLSSLTTENSTLNVLRKLLWSAFECSSEVVVVSFNLTCQGKLVITNINSTNKYENKDRNSDMSDNDNSN